jgi:hypothetical protein
MLQLQNNTRFAAGMALFPNEDAVDTLYVIVKASFNIGKGLTLADEQTPPTASDVYWTEPGKSSIKYASDMHTGKPATDIVMLGHACVPEKKEATQLDVGLTVGQASKTVRVFGDRQWQDGKITRPTPFRTMPMVYEKAFGGVHYSEGQLADAETRNPVGRGFAGTRKTGEMNGVPLPNLEDPRQLIHEPGDRPAPACFGFCAPNWQPRVSYVGTYDDAWRKTRAPYLPADFDPRFLNMAHPDLVFPGYLQGGEPVTITHMHPAGTLKFDVPPMNLVARVKIAGREELPAFRLETLLLEPNQLKFSTLWRAAMLCDKRMLKLSEVKIGTAR